MKFLVTLIFSLAGFAACYSPEKPVCTYACDPVKVENSGHCPPDYECRSDGYCHLVGTTEACSFPPPGDLSVTQDMKVDLATEDSAM